MVLATSHYGFTQRLPVVVLVTSDEVYSLVIWGTVLQCLPVVVLAASDQRFTQLLLLAVLSASDRSAAAFVRVPVITGSKPFETTSSASSTHA